VSDQIIVVCDRSGSMASIASDMEPAMNKFIKEQASVGDAQLRVVMFDDQYEVAFDGPIKGEVPEFKLEPRGMTALCDAVGKAVADVTVSGCAKCGDRTILVVITDGMENASREWNAGSVKSRIKELDKHENFSAVFLGADIDAIGGGAGVGIGANNAVNYSKSRKGTEAILRSTSANMMAFRSGGDKASSMTYTTDQRKEAVDNS